jgi:hypothetical protein
MDAVLLTMSVLIKLVTLTHPRSRDLPASSEAQTDLGRVCSKLMEHFQK